LGETWYIHYRVNPPFYISHLTLHFDRHIQETHQEMT